MPVIALEQHIAENVHAYTATYGPQEQHSTRIKDLIDLLLIADLATPHADRLHTSLTATFSRRERQPLPTALPPPPASWVSPYTRAAADVGLPADLGAAHTEAATFLDPILAGDMIGRSAWRSSIACGVSAAETGIKWVPGSAEQLQQVLAAGAW
jgi:hypothetical protein